MIYGYVRVSCDNQTTENQIFEIKHFAKVNKILINHWINETISGTTDIHRRKLGKLIKQLHKGDIIISTELSRFGRNLLQVMSVLAYCMEKSITVWTIKDNYRLGADLQSKIMEFCFQLIGGNRKKSDFAAHQRSTGQNQSRMENSRPSARKKKQKAQTG